MNNNISQIALLVKDYDEAIAFYTIKLGFELVEDTRLSEEKRWVLIKPSGSSGCQILLARAVGEHQLAAVGNQSGGRVFLFLQTDNFKRDYDRLLANEVKIVREAIVESYGTLAVFADLYGNLWDLIQPAA